MQCWASTATTKTLEVFRSLVGRWKIYRSLGSEGTAQGLAVFTPSPSSRGQPGNIINGPNLLKYREDLEVSLKGDKGESSNKGMTAYQEYLYEYDEKKDQIITKFVDGRLFFELSLEEEGQEGTVVAKGVHLCGDDTYRGTYVFGGDPNKDQTKSEFVLKVEVEGPRKGHTILTRFTRDDDEAT